jgi:hypothetical protein
MIDAIPLYIFLQEMSNVSYNLARWLRSHCMMWIPLSIASDTSHRSQSENKAIHICARKYHHERDSKIERDRERERERVCVCVHA